MDANERGCRPERAVALFRHDKPKALELVQLVPAYKMKVAKKISSDYRRKNILGCGQKSVVISSLGFAKVKHMRANNTTEMKTDKRAVAEAEFAKLMASACVAGFHGSASVTITVQDGHIQYTRIAVERMVR